jgi:predicted DNA-binding transcriptional regulator AlpA
MLTPDSAGALAPVNALFDKRISNQPRYLTSAELANFLRLSEHTIRAWRKLRIITPKKFGRSVRWLLEEVLQELEKRRKPR